MDILFWSGGKDSYLALHFFLEEFNSDNLKLLTTYEEQSNRVPHQNLSLSTIKEQAKNLELDLLAVPLPKNCPNEVYVEKLEQVLENQGGNIRYLIFGDWHLADIREWREQVFGELGYTCLFPIWEKSLNELIPVLVLQPIEIRISAVSEKFQHYLKVGELYNQKIVRQLPEEIDPMGENGEFHTKVIFKDFPER